MVVSPEIFETLCVPAIALGLGQVRQMPPSLVSIRSWESTLRARCPSMLARASTSCSKAKLGKCELLPAQALCCSSTPALNRQAAPNMGGGLCHSP